MRRVLMITAAALAIGVGGAVAAPMHSGGSFGGHGGAGFGSHGRAAFARGGPAGAVTQGGMMAAPQTSPGANVRTNNFGTQNNFAAGNNSPNHMYPNHVHGRSYAWNGRGRHHWHGGGWGGGWGGLYAYEPDYDTCYDNGYWPYYNNGYGNNCYYDYYDEPGPGVSFGWGW